MSGSNTQKGFAPVIIVILVAAFFAFVPIYRHLFNSQSQSTKEASTSASLNSPTPTASPQATTAIKQSKVTQPSASPSSNNQTSSSTPSSSSPSPNYPNPSPSSSASSAPSNSTISPSPSTSSTPLPTGSTVNVTYPNGGESLKVGDNITITWDSNIFGNCQIQTIDPYQSGIVITGVNGVLASNHSINWTVSMGNTTLTSQQYKIHMVCQNFNGGATTAQSNNYFTISK